jgi:hypothetical protein
MSGGDEKGMEQFQGKSSRLLSFFYEKNLAKSR